MKHQLFWGTVVGIVATCGALLYAHLHLNLSLELWAAYACTSITAVAFAFGTYFVTLAIDAYSQLSVLKQSTAAVQDALREISATKEALETARSGISSTTD